MITLEPNGRPSTLHIQFPDLRKNAAVFVHFDRTLRVPADGSDYPMPPSLGRFPLRHLDDVADRLPAPIRERGGVIMPMYPSEALTIRFAEAARDYYQDSYPIALKIGLGKVNALTGDPWSDALNPINQDYLVFPLQESLDGYCTARGRVRQLIAAELGNGQTAEEQISGQARHGGIQIAAYPMKASEYEKLEIYKINWAGPLDPDVESALEMRDIGFAAGGHIRESIRRDPYGAHVWDQDFRSRCFVTVVTPARWSEMTGEPPLSQAPSPSDYAIVGLPWLEEYIRDDALEGSARIAALGKRAID